MEFETDPPVVGVSVDSLSLVLVHTKLVQGVHVAATINLMPFLRI